MKTLKNKLADTLLLLTVGSVFVWGIVCGIMSCTKFTPEYSKIFLHILLIMLILSVICLNKYSLIATLTVIAATMSLIFWNIQSEPYLAELFKNIVEFLRRLVLYIGGYEPYIPKYETVIGWALCGAVSLFAVIFIAVSFKFFVLTGFAVAVFGIALSSGNFSYPLSFIACISCVLVFLVKYLRFQNRTQNRKHISIKHEYSGRILINIAAVAVVALCLGIAYFIPVPQAGFKDKVTNTVIYAPFRAANKFISGIFAPKYFSLSAIGYPGEDNKLGGDISLGDDVVMEVATSGRNLYLAGAVKDRYTGFSWENTSPQNELFVFDESGITVDFIEWLFSNLMISLNNGEFEEIAKVLANPEKILDTWYSSRCEYIPDGTLTLQMQQHTYTLKNAAINIKDMRTFSVFSPYMMTGITKNDNPVTVLKDGQNNLTVKNLMPKNALYTVYFREESYTGTWGHIKSNSRREIYRDIYNTLQKLHEKYDFDKNQVSLLLDESLDEDRDNLHMFKMYPAGEEYFNPAISMNYEDLLTEVLIPRADEIYSKYTELPSNFPKRIINLAKDITEVYENDFEKADAIRLFLRCFPYTLTPGDTPEDRDFVDYFLFDLQTGYCTYYASAFVTMCRAIGLPARYVEGYVMPPKKNEEGIYVVTKKQGHAWGEVYFEGYGWIKFEPTPAESSQGRLSRLPSAENYPLEPFEPLESLDISPQTEQSNFENRENLGANINTAMPFEFSAGNIEEFKHMYQNLLSSQNYNNTTKNAQKIVAYNLLISVLMLVIGFVLYIVVRFMFGRKNDHKILRQENNKVAVVMYFHNFLKYLKFFNYEMKDSETIAKFIDRIGDNISFGLAYEDETGVFSIKNTAEIFSRACYGNGVISPDERNIIRCTLIDIDDMLLKSVGRIRYMYYKYILRAF